MDGEDNFRPAELLRRGSTSNAHSANHTVQPFVGQNCGGAVHNILQTAASPFSLLSAHLKNIGKITFKLKRQGAFHGKQAVIAYSDALVAGVLPQKFRSINVQRAPL